uniref:Deoxyhypusine synthase n=1 Tax=Plectus sambesii TaxID=2011161 RepID=A0A914WIT9_9BILA
MQDLINNYMSKVLPDATIKKIKKEIDNSNGAYELCESLKKSSIFTLLTFFRGLEKTGQDHLFFSFGTGALFSELLSILDNT